VVAENGLVVVQPDFNLGTALFVLSLQAQQSGDYRKSGWIVACAGMVFLVYAGMTVFSRYATRSGYNK
jgi:hypothetical protein